MMVVIDTNVLVSAFWSKDGVPATIIGMILNGSLTLCYDYRIICEYREVLHRPKFGFSNGEVNAILEWFETNGQSIIAEPVKEKFIDKDDKKFYEVAKQCGAILITGNLKHFPNDSQVTRPADFLEKYS